MARTPKWTVLRPLPSLAKLVPTNSSYGESSYVVADPDFLATGHTIGEQGNPISDMASHFSFGGGLIAGLGTAFWAFSWAEHPLSKLLGFAFFGGIGLIVGAVTGGALGVLLNLVSGDGVRGYLKKTGNAAVVQRVEIEGSPAWRLCAMVDDVAQTRAWSDGLLDNSKRVPEILWNAVVRAAEVQDMKTVLAEARQHPSLRELAAVQGKRIESVEKALSGVESRLGEVRRTARAIDKRVERAERARIVEEKRREDEQRLRAKLLDAQPVGANALADIEDSAAGLVVETQSISTWLNESLGLLDSVSSPAAPPSRRHRP